jgi:hypothetical protein
VPAFGFLPPDVFGLLTSLILGPRAMPIPMNAAGSSSPCPDRSGNLERKLGEAASPPPLVGPPGPPDVDGRPSMVAPAAGDDRIGGVHSPPGLPKVGSRDGASGEKLNFKLSGAGTLVRVNLADDSLLTCTWDESEVGAGSVEPMSPAGDASDHVVESGVGGPITPGPGPGPKSNLKPVSTTGFGRPRSSVSTVGAGLGWLRSRLTLGCRSWGVFVREGGELCEL